MKNITRVNQFLYPLQYHGYHTLRQDDRTQKKEVYFVSFDICLPEKKNDKKNDKKNISKSFHTLQIIDFKQYKCSFLT